MGEGSSAHCDVGEQAQFVRISVGLSLRRFGVDDLETGRLKYKIKCKIIIENFLLLQKNPLYLFVISIIKNLLLFLMNLILIIGNQDNSCLVLHLSFSKL